MHVFTRHPLLLQTAFSELKRQALELPSILEGTPGSVGTRDVNGRPFFYRQFYDAEGKKAAQYIGSAEDPKATARAEALREQIALTKALVKDARFLTERGYVRTDPRTGAIVAVLANRGLFRAGAFLVGSHAYGALLNDLGVRAAAFATEELEVARIAGKAVPELRAHATALPHLRYLLTGAREAVLIGREGIIPVRVPRPEVFAWHKMLVSQLRTTTSEKSPKDLLQATVIFAVLAEDAPDALESAFAAIPRAARTKTVAGARRVLTRLEAAGHERARDLMSGIV